jgi:hypothetical protein
MVNDYKSVKEEMIRQFNYLDKSGEAYITKFTFLVGFLIALCGLITQVKFLYLNNLFGISLFILFIIPLIACYVVSILGIWASNRKLSPDPFELYQYAIKKNTIDIDRVIAYHIQNSIEKEISNLKKKNLLFVISIISLVVTGMFFILNYSYYMSMN